MTNLDSIFKSRDITLSTKIRLVKAIWFFQWSCMDVRVGLWRKLSAEELMLLFKKTIESRLDCKEIQPVHPKGDQPWDFFGGNDAKAETPILWPPHSKSWLIGKDSDTGRDWEQEKKGTTEDEMAGCHHWLDGHEFEWTPEVGDGQGGLACCAKSWTWLNNWTELALGLLLGILISRRANLVMSWKEHFV